MFGMGMSEMLIILVVALLVVGPDKLPNAARAIGKGIRDLRRHTLDLQDTIEADENIGGAVRELKSALHGDPRAKMASALGLNSPPLKPAPASPKAVVGPGDPVAPVGHDTPTAPYPGAPTVTVSDPPPDDGGAHAEERPAAAAPTADPRVTGAPRVVPAEGAIAKGDASSAQGAVTPTLAPAESDPRHG